MIRGFQADNSIRCWYLSMLYTMLIVDLHAKSGHVHSEIKSFVLLKGNKRLFYYEYSRTGCIRFHMTALSSDWQPQSTWNKRCTFHYVFPYLMIPLYNVTFCIFVYAVTVHCDQGLSCHLAR